VLCVVGVGAQVYTQVSSGIVLGFTLGVALSHFRNWVLAISPKNFGLGQNLEQLQFLYQRVRFSKLRVGQKKRGSRLKCNCESAKVRQLLQVVDFIEVFFEKVSHLLSQPVALLIRPPSQLVLFPCVSGSYAMNPANHPDEYPYALVNLWSKSRRIV
jgi:hypothetical protein